VRAGILKHERPSVISKACAPYCSQQAVCADALKHERPIIISNISVASGMGQAATGCNFFVAATAKLPVRALSYKAVFSIRATKQLSNLSCQCAPSLKVYYIQGAALKTAPRRTASVTAFTSVFEITYRILEYVLEMTFFNSEDTLDFEESETQANSTLNFLQSLQTITCLYRFPYWNPLY
jgi:hypothetical protein